MRNTFQQPTPTTLEESFSSLDIQYDHQRQLAWYRMNAQPRPCFTPALLEEIDLWFDHLTREPEYAHINYIVMGSSIPAAFNLGGDLNLFCDLIRNKDRDGLMRYAIACIKPLFRIHTGLGKNVTTISLVQGDALGGGCEVAISSDILIAERSAKMGLPEILFNLFPGMGAYSFLSRKIGPVQAEKMILGGRLYSAEEMFELGLVDAIAEDGEGEKAVLEYIKKENRARNGYRAFRQAKRHCNAVTYDELKKITTIWVDSALNLNDNNLRMMERLVTRQSAKASHH